MTAAERLLALLDHLGIGKAYVATQIPADIAGLTTQHAERLGGIVLCTPVRLDPAPFAALAERVLMISGEYGPTFEVCLRAADRLPGVERTVLDSYERWAGPMWRRPQRRDRSRMTGFCCVPPRSAPPATEGSHAGISYKIEGKARLAAVAVLWRCRNGRRSSASGATFTVVTWAGGIGGIAALEDAPACRPIARCFAR
jgi:hypothetical protein